MKTDNDGDQKEAIAQEEPFESTNDQDVVFGVMRPRLRYCIWASFKLLYVVLP